MKVLLLSDANSIHTFKWIKSLNENKVDLQLFTFIKPKKDILDEYTKLGVKIICPDLQSKIKNLREPNLSKLNYLKSIPFLRKAIRSFNPDIVHAHYASSYGIIGLLCGFKPLILSVWGSDIYYFPYKSKLYKWLLRLVIKYSNEVCSTSIAMKELIEKEYKRFDLNVVPFGIDTKNFKPSYKKEHRGFVVGTIKSIEDHNGIDCLIDAAKIVIDSYSLDVNFLIVGDGSLRNKMQEKTKKLKIDDKIDFKGFINHKNVIKYYNLITIFVAVSTRESFGVSVLEAAACQIPSITSNIGGLAEVNLHKKTGLVIDANDPEELAKSILKLYKDDALRNLYGRKARERVEKSFNWTSNVNKMINIYKKYT